MDRARNMTTPRPVASTTPLPTTTKTVRRLDSRLRNAQLRHSQLSSHDVLQLEQSQKRVRLLVRTINALHEPLARVDAALGPEFR